jgi:hypothetical protein
MGFVNRIAIALALTAAIASSVAAQQQPQNPPSQPAPEAGRPRVGGFPIGPPGKILELRAEPSTIGPGQSTTLYWHAVNADDTYFDNCLGIVATLGKMTISPAATSTYTFTAKGRAGSDTKSVTVTVVGTNPVPPSTDPGCVDPHNQPIPQAPDGHPDLSGVYIAGFSLRPVSNIPLKPGAEKYKVVEDVNDLGLGVTCTPPGVPAATMQPYPLQIIQKPGLVVILYEAYGIFRVIPTDGRPHPDDLDPTYMGNSVGHWEGDTLVVDVTGFNDKTIVGSYHHTTAYHVVERYHRVSYEELDYEATIDDPNVFAAPWKQSARMRLHPEWQIQEYVCEQNNKNYQELFIKKKK